MIIQGSNDMLMAVAAHRYCLGRSSYIVGACQDWLAASWDQLNTNTQNVILRDTLEALHTGRAGFDGEARSWRKAAQSMWERMDDLQKGQVRLALSRRDILNVEACLAESPRSNKKADNEGETKW